MFEKPSHLSPDRENFDEKTIRFQIEETEAALRALESQRDNASEPTANIEAQIRAKEERLTELREKLL